MFLVPCRDICIFAWDACQGLAGWWHIAETWANSRNIHLLSVVPWRLKCQNCFAEGVGFIGLVVFVCAPWLQIAEWCAHERPDILWFKVQGWQCPPWTQLKQLHINFQKHKWQVVASRFLSSCVHKPQTPNTKLQHTTPCHQIAQAPGFRSYIFWTQGLRWQCPSNSYQGSKLPLFSKP
jgi:hypothetical protein